MGIYRSRLWITIWYKTRDKRLCRLLELRKVMGIPRVPISMSRLSKSHAYLKVIVKVIKEDVNMLHLGIITSKYTCTQREQ